MIAKITSLHIRMCVTLILIFSMPICAMKNCQQIISAAAQQECWVSGRYVAYLARQNKYPPIEFFSWVNKGGRLTWKKIPQHIQKKICNEWYYQQYKEYCYQKNYLECKALNNVREFIGLQQLYSALPERVTHKQLRNCVQNIYLLKELYEKLPSEVIKKEITPRVIDLQSSDLCCKLLPNRFVEKVIVAPVCDLKINASGLCLIDGYKRLQFYESIQSNNTLASHSLTLDDDDVCCFENISVVSPSEMFCTASIATSHFAECTITKKSDEDGIIIKYSKEFPILAKKIHKLTEDLYGCFVGLHKERLFLYWKNAKKNGFYSICVLENYPYQIDVDHLLQLGNTIVCAALDNRYVFACTIEKREQEFFFIIESICRSELIGEGGVASLIKHTPTQFFYMDKSHNPIIGRYSLCINQDKKVSLSAGLSVKFNFVTNVYPSICSLLRDEVILIGSLCGIFIYNIKDGGDVSQISSYPVRAITVQNEVSFFVVEKGKENDNLVHYSWNHYNENLGELFCRNLLQNDDKKLWK